MVNGDKLDEDMETKIIVVDIEFLHVLHCFYMFLIESQDIHF